MEYIFTCNKEYRCDDICVSKEIYVSNVINEIKSRFNNFLKNIENNYPLITDVIKKNSDKID